MKWKNAFSMGIGALKANLLGNRIPLNVMLSVTNRCTGRCSYCRIPLRKQQELTLPQILDLVDQLGEMGTQRLGLWGGEPLMRDDIGEIITYAKNKGMYVTMDTNGHLLPQRIEEIADVDHVVIGFDGPREIHEKYRGKGTYDKVIRAFEAGQNRLKLWTITVLTRENIGHIEDIVEHARKYNLLTTFQVVHHNDRLGKEIAGFIPSDEEYKTAVKRLVDLKKQGAPIVSSYNYLHYLLKWDDFSSPMRDVPVNNLKCWAGSLYCNVDTDGTVYPCSLLIEKMDALNFLDVGFRKAFDHIKEVPCKACDASCFTEYNYLFSLNPTSILGWLRCVKR